MDGKLALDTVKSFKEIMSQGDYQEFLKSEDSEKLRSFPEVQEFIKSDDMDDDDEGKKKKEAEEAEEARKKKEAEEAEKGMSGDVLLKSISDEIGVQLETKLKGVSDLLVKSLGANEEISEIKKSLEGITETLAKIAGMPLGNKAAKVTPTFLEKALSGSSEDGEGKSVLSIALHKEKVLDSLEKGMSSTTDEELIKSYESSIIRYNGGGGSISQEVAVDLYNNHGVRLVK